MLKHQWNSTTDWQYCNIINCIISNNNVILNQGYYGTIVSDIRDSSERIHNYTEVIPKISVPLSTAALLYLRSGSTAEYDETSWTDWKLINEPEQLMEYTLSLTNNKIIVDYNIKSIANIYCVNNSEYQTLAMNLNTIYLTPLTDADANNELYSYLWSGLTDEAITDFAKTDQEGEPLTTYATGATFVNNVITLTNTLPLDNSIVIVKYTPRNFIYSDINRYVQFKIELLPMDNVFFQDHDNLNIVTSDDNVFCVSSGDSVELNPTVFSMEIYYKLNFQTELENAFPNLFRRL